MKNHVIMLLKVSNEKFKIRNFKTTLYYMKTSSPILNERGCFFWASFLHAPPVDMEENYSTFINQTDQSLLATG